MSDELELCSYGLNYQRVSPELLIAGLVVQDFPRDTLARRKMKAKLGKAVVRRADVEAVVAQARESIEKLAAELRERRDAVIASTKLPVSTSEKWWNY